MAVLDCIVDVDEVPCARGFTVYLELPILGERLVQVRNQGTAPERLPRTIQIEDTENKIVQPIQLTVDPEIVLTSLLNHGVRGPRAT